ncbi:MAG: sulfatase-like hydrolase/transferase, partial [Planctomycetota bacterium]
LTGRCPVRCGVPSHGYALRHQEPTIIEALQQAGYATGHFGKWHLDGLRGPGVPIFEDDPFHPGKFGFDHWASVTNFFDRNPLLSHEGDFRSHQGDSSEVTVELAIDFMKQCHHDDKPFACVIWYGTPHSPFVADGEDVKSLSATSAKHKALVDAMDNISKQHYGELVAMDRSLGTLQDSLAAMGLSDETMIWFNSDNGGLPKIEPSTTGSLRGHKGQLFEGGIRVPCVVTWPNQIPGDVVSRFPSSTSDIAPTILDLLQLSDDALLTPRDGQSIADQLRQTEGRVDVRASPMGFRFNSQSAVVDGRWKLIRGKSVAGGEALFDLDADVSESTSLIETHPEQALRLRNWLDDFESSVESSRLGRDYPSGQVAADHPQPRFWTEVPAYQAIFDQLKDRPEYRQRIKQASR